MALGGRDDDHVWRSRLCALGAARRSPSVPTRRAGTNGGLRSSWRRSFFAGRWWNSKRLRISENTIVDYEWRLSYLRRFFGRYDLSRIDVALVDRFRDELRRESETIRLATGLGTTRRPARRAPPSRQPHGPA